MNTATWGLVLGLVGTLVSLGLAIIKVHEVFFHHPSFKADLRWTLTSPDVVDGMSIVIMNLGRAKGGVLRVGFTGPDLDHHVWPKAVYEDFPIVLDVNDVSRRFEVDMTTFDVVALGLRDGTLTTFTIVDLNGKETNQAIPSKPEVPVG
jgi:hypothetical protein